MFDCRGRRFLFAALVAIGLVLLSGGCWSSDTADEEGPVSIGNGPDADALGDDTVEDDVGPDTSPEVGPDTTGPSPILEAPSVLEIPETEPDHSTTVSFTLLNIGDRPVVVEKLELRESGDDVSEITPGPQWESGTTLGPSDTDANSATFSFEYAPKNTKPDSGSIVVHADDAGLDGGTKTIDLQFPEFQPRVEVPKNVRFGEAPQGDDYAKTFQIRNTGSAELTVQNVRLSGASAFSVAFFDPQSPGTPDPSNGKRNSLWPADGVPESIGPDETIGIRVWFQPTTSDAASGTITVQTTDPRQSEKTVQLSANRSAPCLRVAPEKTLDFGATTVGQSSERTITVSPCTDRSVRIESLDLADDGSGVYSLKSSSVPSLPTEIAAGESLAIVVRFTPSGQSTFAGEIVVESNDPSRARHSIELTGSGTDNDCPNAEAKARVKGTNTWKTTLSPNPRQTVEFTGMGSSDPNGTVQRYSWSIIQRPTDSTARLTPNSNVEDPELFLDIAGTYKVELVVYDDDGTASCGGRALVTIDATPSGDINVELVWNTPADSDQTDSNGADLDLHYLNKTNASEWNTSPWDIFWHNKTADWGVSGDSSDDPQMTVDDTDGAGPEIVIHSNPASNVNYGVGVYYYDDHGFGPSYATVRIYYQGTLRREFKNEFLSGTFEFWNVAVIEGAANNIYKRDVKTTGFPNSN